MLPKRASSFFVYVNKDNLFKFDRSPIIDGLCLLLVNEITDNDAYCH